VVHLRYDVQILKRFRIYCVSSPERLVFANQPFLFDFEDVLLRLSVRISVD